MTATPFHRLAYRVRFLTPAFLGNAEQSAAWRTPPFKALLRQWWRVVFAAEMPGAGVPAMRDAEGHLFGHAWLEQDRDERGRSVAARRSLVRLRLDDWQAGKLRTWDGLEQLPVQHPEVERAGGKVAPHVYLGFGPLTVEGRSTVLTKGRAAIQAGDGAILRVAVPADESHRVQRALSLMHAYGTAGGRSRNGWGSLVLQPEGGTPAFGDPLDRSLTMPWQEALGADWPQAVGLDGQGVLAWQTEAMPDWQRVMRRLAEVKIGVRRRFLFPHAKPDGQIHERHWLSYPVTGHQVQAWHRTGLRLPNSLRFKVRQEADGRLRGVIFHMPCLPPPAFRPDRTSIQRVWKGVHEHLDDDKLLKRIPY